MLLLSVAGLSQSVSAQENDPSPVVIKKDEPAPEEGFWVSFEHYNLIVSGCEMLEKDVQSYKKALERCQKKRPEKDQTDPLVWGGLGFGIGTATSLIVVIILL